eukprot:gene42371-56296_t
MSNNPAGKATQGSGFLQIQDVVSKRFAHRGGGGEHLAVDRVDLVVPRNRVVALVGESGS